MKNRVIAANHLKQEISVSKRVFQQGKLLFVTNEVQLMKAKVQSVVVSFVQNERNTLYQIDVIHLLICDKDRIFFSFLEDLSHTKSSACAFILHFVKHY